LVLSVRAIYGSPNSQMEVPLCFSLNRSPRTRQLVEQTIDVVRAVFHCLIDPFPVSDIREKSPEFPKFSHFKLRG